MVICKGFEFLPEDDEDGGCGIQTMTGPLLQESPYTDLAQYVGREKKVTAGKEENLEILLS